MDAPNSTTTAETFVTGLTSLGMEVHGTLVKLTRFGVLFETYGPGILQMSEVLTEFRIIINGHTTYSGQATVRNLINTGQVLICEATLDERAWRDVRFDPEAARNGAVKRVFNEFFQEWQKVYKVLPEYKTLIVDIQVFLTDLRLWLEQFELGVRAMPSGDRDKAERDLVEALTPPISTTLNHFFEQFELVAGKIEPELRPMHGNYAKRQLHPLLLCSPFMHRIYRKPLGYAGDYEMVNMILRDPHEGSSLFSKVLNRWFLSQTPAEAHRNRVQRLTQRIAEETLRAGGRKLRIFNLGCGPAREVADFISQYASADQTEFTLLDFNEETLAHTSSALSEVKRRSQRATPVRMVRKSAIQLLKTAGRNQDEHYDLIYCAGLFDYLQDRICRQLLNVMYGMLTPGGLLMATNVDSTNPIQHVMDLVFDWHLLYRSHKQFAALAPESSPPDNRQLIADPTGCNIFIEVRKPLN